MTNRITLPELCFVILVGTSGSGKSTFARKHFKPTEILSSDTCRGLVSDDENDQNCTKDAFEILHFIAEKRLAAGKLTVIDATNVQQEARASLIQLARKYHVLPVAIVLDLPKELCHARNQQRTDRQFGKHVIWNQHNQLQRSLKSLRKREGLTNVHVLTSPEEVDTVSIERQPLWTNKKHEHGPFDIIGDIHGCFSELQTLLHTLGYQLSKQEHYHVSHPEGRKLIFVGDLVDRGPDSPEVLRLVMDTVASGAAFCVNGNHDHKLKRYLQGKNVTIAHGLQETLDQLERQPAAFKEQVKEFLDSLISHYVFDDGKLAVAHAGLKQHYIGRGSPRIREFCMYGETTGEIDAFGLPVRYPWARDYRGDTLIVYGHTPVPEPEFLNNTINIDTGCVFGGKLTALRYPERELVSVAAANVYCEPVRPLDHEAQQHAGDALLLDMDDVSGKRIVSTELHHTITIREENATAALEVMSRFAIDPRWLIYLPPTMSPTETSKEPSLLEHPAEAFAYYRKRGVEQVVAQEKHMGSRAIVVVCRDNQAARERFGITGGESGVCYTRTGRSFFSDPAVEQAFIERVQHAIGRAGLWEQLNTSWLCLDGELMPWSAKAQALLEQQYAPTGVAGEVSLSMATAALAKAQHVEGVAGLLEKQQQRLASIIQYRQAYRPYCWPVLALDDYRFAPFHVLAFENSHTMDKDHTWHMQLIDTLCQADSGLLKTTRHKRIDLHDDNSCAEATTWWHDMTESGGEGMVVKPLSFTVKTGKGLLQPGIKCRGREYLRIIYGPEYTLPEHLERLRSRNLQGKRSLALREYALGYEALKRFVAKEPLHRVHEAVFAVLALESEPVDPRL